MPNGDVALMTEQACERTHDALNVEIKGMHCKMDGMSNRIWGLIILVVFALGGIFASRSPIGGRSHTATARSGSYVS